MNLTLTRLIALACIGSAVWALPIQAFAVASPATTVAQGTAETEAGGMPEDLIRDRARLIAVRVFKVNQEEWKNSGLILDVSGSGILIDRKYLKKDPDLYLYLVLTNNHVAKESQQKKDKECEFYIQTLDGLIHKACHHPTAKFDGNDLALLYFYSPYPYEKAVTSKASSLNYGDKVFVAGFPCDLGATSVPCPADFTFLQGEVKKLPDKPLVDGYQIGYTNEVIEGTSGGPVLNNKGEVVGINGRREGGSDSTYTYADNTKPDLTEIEEMRQLRWGIPIDIYLNLDTQNLFREIPKATEEFKQIRYTEKKSNSKNPEQSSSTKKPQVSDKPKDQEIAYWVAGATVIFILYNIIIIIICLRLFLRFKNKGKRAPIRNQQALPPSAPNQEGRGQQVGIVNPGGNIYYYPSSAPFNYQILRVIIDKIDRYAMFEFCDGSRKIITEYTAQNQDFIRHCIRQEAEQYLEMRINTKIPFQSAKIYPEVVHTDGNYQFYKDEFTPNCWKVYKISQKPSSVVVVKFSTQSSIL